MAIEITKKPLKRRLFDCENSHEQKISSCTNGSEDEKSTSSSMSSPNTEKQPLSLDKNPRHLTPLSERQQIALLCRLTKEEKSEESDESKVCQSSLEKKSTPNTVFKRNKKGETQLHLATIRKDLLEVKKLVQDGFDVDTRDFAGWTALHEACNIGELSIANYLLKSGADVDALGFDRFTPLHDAAANGHDEIVKLLLNYGANPNTKNAQWKTPLDVAVTESVCKILREATYSSDLTLNSTCEGPTPKKPVFWHSQHESSCYTTDDPCNLTMKNNSSHKHKGLGADKPTSPRLTLRFQSIKSRNEKNTKSPKANEFSSDQTKYPSYCVTMEDKGNAKKCTCRSPTLPNEKGNVKNCPSCTKVPNEDGAITSAPNSKSSPEREADPPKSTNDKGKDVPTEMEVLNSAIPMDTQEENSDAKASSDKTSTDVVMKEREYSSDTEKEERRCKRRKSSDGVHSRRLSIGNGSGIKREKVLSGKVQNGQTDVSKASPKTKKKTGNSGSDTESNSSTPEVPTSEYPNSLGGQHHNGALTAGLPSLKVPPLKIVIPSGSSSLEPETRERSKLASTKTALPYVVNTSESSGRGSLDSSNDTSAPLEDNVKTTESTTTTPSKSKDENQPTEERVQRVTRSSQRIQAALSSTATADSSHGGTPGSSHKGDSSGESMGEEHSTPVTHNIHPRKWKLRPRDSSNMESDAASSGFSSEVGHHRVPQQPAPLLNSYQLYLNIRKQVNKRRKSMFVVHPEPPHGFKDYLLNRCSYVLEGNAASRLSVPMIPPPQSLEGSIKDLFVQQEKERYRLRLQHLIEREKLVLSAEQEIVRVHARAARALANQTVPLSVCSILKDEEIYNVLDVEREEKEKNVRSRYNSRLFLSWLQDVDDKWEKIKRAMLLRHHNEAESLHAVQKLDWGWKMKELAMCDMKTTPVIDDISVPIVRVNDDFELLPT